MFNIVKLSLVITALAVFAFASPVSAASALTRYQVTITNLTSSQVLSPPVAATHEKAFRMFQVGRLASHELADIAQAGQEGVPSMVSLLTGSKHVSDFVVAPPLITAGNTFGPYTDTVTFVIHAKPEEDRFSFSTMLICTNDGFTGLDSEKLPESGSKIFWVSAFDAGSENNTELSQDLPDSCSFAGPVFLAGDLNGNEDGAAVATVPAVPIRTHTGIFGVGHLTPAIHNWTSPVARVTITRIDDAE